MCDVLFYTVVILYNPFPQIANASNSSKLPLWTHLQRKHKSRKMGINDLSFNQNFTSLLMSTDEDHRIFNCDPFGEFYVLSSKDKEKCPTAFLRMLFSTSLTIIVPDTQSSMGNRVLKVMNLKTNMKICELNFPLGIVDLMVNRKRLVVFLEVGQIYIYDLSSIRLVKVVEVNAYKRNGDDAMPNPVIADLSADDSSYLILPILVLNDNSDILNADSTSSQNNSSQPGTPVLRPSDSTVANSLDTLIELTQKNSLSLLSSIEGITLEDLQKDSQGWVLVYDTLNLKPLLVYKAHDTAIARIAISSESKYIATASTKGTIIRVCHLDSDFVVEYGKLKIAQVINLRRGHNVTRISTLRFNSSSTILGCASDSNTIHFFTVHENTQVGNGDRSEQEDDADSTAEEDENGRSLEDLNENLANLLLLKPAEEREREEPASYFLALKKSAKLLNNQYTKRIVKKLPYREYLGNLIWEAPRRSFAFIKLPEYVPSANLRHKNVEIGFGAQGVVMLASYNTGTLYHYRLPKPSSEREECGLLSLNSLCV